MCTRSVTTAKYCFHASMLQETTQQEVVMQTQIIARNILFVKARICPDLSVRVISITIHPRGVQTEIMLCVLNEISAPQAREGNKPTISARQQRRRRPRRHRPPMSKNSLNPVILLRFVLLVRGSPIQGKGTVANTLNAPTLTSGY